MFVSPVKILNDSSITEYLSIPDTLSPRLGPAGSYVRLLLDPQLLNQRAAASFAQVNALIDQRRPLAEFELTMFELLALASIDKVVYA